MSRLYGLIGYPLTHSFSPGYFSAKFEREQIQATYTLFPISDISEFPDLVNRCTPDGLNVTIPYKEKIIPYLDALDDVAAAIGAVNTIQFADGKMTGYNTDAPAFWETLMTFTCGGTTIQGALVLGTGGASSAVAYMLKQNGIQFKTIGRTNKADLRYDDLDASVFNAHNLIINTTPLGMYPDIDACPPIPYHLLNENYFLYDLIYNPEKTLFLSEGSKRNAKIFNGLAMLQQQAEYAWQIWNQPVM